MKRTRQRQPVITVSEYPCPRCHPTRVAPYRSSVRPDIRQRLLAGDESDAGKDDGGRNLEMHGVPATDVCIFNGSTFLKLPFAGLEASFVHVGLEITLVHLPVGPSTCVEVVGKVVQTASVEVHVLTGRTGTVGKSEDGGAAEGKHRYNAGNNAGEMHFEW